MGPVTLWEDEHPRRPVSLADVARVAVSLVMFASLAFVVISAMRGL